MKINPSRRLSGLGLGLVVLLSIAAAAEGQAPRKVPEGLNFANGLYRERRYDLAAEEYERFLKAADANATVADRADGWFGLGNARLFLGKYAEARQAFESFVKVAPDHPNTATVPIPDRRDVVRPRRPGRGPAEPGGLRRQSRRRSSIRPRRPGRTSATSRPAGRTGRRRGGPTSRP